MTLLLADIGTAAFAAVAVCTAVGAAHAVQRLKNQRAAWVHRERHAQLTFKVSADANAPCVVRKALIYLADRAFDTAFMKDIRRAAALAEKSTLLEDIRREHGDAYAGIVAEAFSAMAFVVLLDDRATGSRLRAWAKKPHRMHEVRENKVRPIRESISERVFADPSDDDMAPAPAIGVAG